MEFKAGRGQQEPHGLEAALHPTAKLGVQSVPNLMPATQILDCITRESWEFFDILKQPPSFLAKPVKDWDEDDVFIKIGRVVRSMKVVNDCAERGIGYAA